MMNGGQHAHTLTRTLSSVELAITAGIFGVRVLKCSRRSARVNDLISQNDRIQWFEHSHARAGHNSPLAVLF